MGVGQNQRDSTRYLFEGWKGHPSVGVHGDTGGLTCRECICSRVLIACVACGCPCDADLLVVLSNFQ